MGDLARLRKRVNAGELDPFHVPNDGCTHISHSPHPARYNGMMEAVAVPPFERFYLEHRDAVFGFLVRRIGRSRAEDAFQETFLRALRGWHTLRHGRYLRAWVLTIAARVALDTAPRPGGSEPLTEEPAVDDGQPAYVELAFLADELPPTERAAVVLRYGYDLPYADIGAALGSSEQAARAAASSGIRRLRKKEGLT